MSNGNHHYDVLVVGSGNAACAAALSAVDEKVRVGVLEKAPQRDRGGNSALTGHLRFVFNGIDDLRPLVKNTTDAELHELLERLPRRTEADAWDEIMRVTDNQTDQDLLQVHVTESLNTIHWLAAKGHDWVPGSRWNENILNPNGGGFGLQQRYYGMLEKAGVDFHYGTAAVELIQDRTGAITGVQALTPNGFRTFSAKCVVLACGSFESNPEMRARYLGRGWDMVHVRGVPYNTGDGLRMAMDVGAMPHGSWSTCHASPQDIALPLFTVPSGAMHAEFNRYMHPYCIMVNTRGERFVDEADDLRGRTYAKMGLAILSQPGGVAFQILDAKARSLNLYPANYAKATTAKAATLEQLGAELDINVPNFVRTVKEFNAAVPSNLPPFSSNPVVLDGRSTVGLPLPKSNYSMVIEEPPFEAFPVRCGMTFTFGGLKIDPATAQVQHVAGYPMKGLYAAGEMVGGLWV
ncbi:MAG TPA: FAD-dependent tricarballylate dehydrogenase TcuA, partial [Burkholderiales bacterium]|nr:FAD-dependent tricarballylate dehydrogenase TcuA [Burkholderiales bacterium]